MCGDTLMGSERSGSHGMVLVTGKIKKGTKKQKLLSHKYSVKVLFCKDSR